MTYALKSVPHNCWSTETWKKIEHWAASTHAVPSLSLCGSLLRIYREKDAVLVMENTAGLVFNIQQCRTCVQHTCKMHIACLAEGRAFAHARNIWHRDIKPQNLLLNSQGHCKLADFGSAEVGAADRTWSCVATLEYRAPELVQGAGYNEAVDWWAFVPFETCSRKQLFPGKAHEVLSAIIIFVPLQGRSGAVEVLVCCKASKSDPCGRNQEARLVWRLWMAAGKARQREISVPDLFNKAYYNCSCFFSSLWPKCFCRLFQSNANSEWRGNCQCEGKVSSEGFKEDVTHGWHVSQAAARRSAAKKWKASCKLWVILESTEPDPKMVSQSTSLATPDPLFHDYTNANTPWYTLSIHS